MSVIKELLSCQLFSYWSNENGCWVLWKPTLRFSALWYCCM